MKCKFCALLFALLSFCFLQSCVDKEYDFDNLNKEGTFYIPPVPLGSIDTIFVTMLDGLPSIPDSLIPPGIGNSVAFSDTIKGLFNEDVNSRFFFDGAGNVSLQTDADLHVLTEASNVRAMIGFSVLDENGKLINEVKIPSVELVYGVNAGKQILFASQYMKYMANASDLHITIVIKAESLSFNSKNYLLFNNVVLKSGGISFDF